MAEAFAVAGVAANIIAIIQIADRVIGLCKFYLGNVHDAPSDLRAIFVEISAIKTSLESLQFLDSCNSRRPSLLDGLSGDNGPIKGCENAIAKLEGLFPSDIAHGSKGGRSKRRKVNAASAALAWPLKEKRATGLLKELEQYKTTIHFALTMDSMHDINDIKNTSNQIHEILTDSQRREVCEWLEVTDPSPLHHRAYKHYEPGTGDWILRSPEWANWLQGKQRCLWIHGIPGAGKTVLISHLIEELKEHCRVTKTSKRAYVYYYCYFGHNQDEAAPFLKWTISHLCRKVDHVPTYVYQLYRHGGEPSLEELLSGLEAILDCFGNAYIVVDAIDESKPRDDLLRVLRDLATDSRFQKVHLLATSREYIDIENVMQPVSVPVSMSNPLLEHDIRQYVRAQMTKSPKFKRWPQLLQDEVVEILSTKAKGMFRWAACQLYALQNLKGASTVVQNALANLPKDLNETYERIFLSIPNEDRSFVHLALKWIYYHNEYRRENITCTLLLQAIRNSMHESTPSEQDYHYDEDLLRELCGCLITLTPEERKHYGLRNTTLTVTFAHYTVWEFLNSPQILSSSSAFFSAREEKTKFELTKIVLLEALNTQPNNGRDWTSTAYDKNEVIQVVAEDFNTWCMVQAIFSIYHRSDELSEQEDLCTLSIAILDPARHHFERLEAAARQIDQAPFWYPVGDIGHFGQFWNVEWNVPVSKVTDAALVINLLRLDESGELGKRCLENLRKEEVLRSRLDLGIKLRSDGDELRTYSFEGSIIDLFAQLSGVEAGPFKMLLNLGAGVFDPSVTLLSFIGSHDHGYNCEDICLLQRLLQLGATANVPGYRVTPLQIAVGYWDYEVIKTLLKAGAEPNGVGDGDGIEWKENSFLGRFNHLHGISPLRIVRKFYFLSDIEDTERAKTEAMLLRYGAKEFEVRND